MKRFKPFLILMAFFIVTIAAAGDAPAGPKRSKVIDFDDELVEGVNKKPLDSYSQISEANKRRKKLHLYRKRAGYRLETRELLTEMRLQQ